MTIMIIVIIMIIIVILIIRNYIRYTIGSWYIPVITTVTAITRTVKIAN